MEYQTPGIAQAVGAGPSSACQPSEQIHMPAVGATVIWMATEAIVAPAGGGRVAVSRVHVCVFAVLIATLVPAVYVVVTFGPTQATVIATVTVPNVPAVRGTAEVYAEKLYVFPVETGTLMMNGTPAAPAIAPVIHTWVPCQELVIGPP